MWSYECIFECLKEVKTKKKQQGTPMAQTSETIVTDTDMQALEYVIDQLKLHPDQELVGIIRRNPIVKIIKE